MVIPLIPLLFPFPSSVVSRCTLGEVQVGNNGRNDTISARDISEEDTVHRVTIHKCHLPRPPCHLISLQSKGSRLQEERGVRNSSRSLRSSWVRGRHACRRGPGSKMLDNTGRHGSKGVLRELVGSSLYWGVPQRTLLKGTIRGSSKTLLKTLYFEEKL